MTQQPGWGQPPAPQYAPQGQWGQPAPQQQAPWGQAPQQQGQWGQPAAPAAPAIPAESGDEFDDFFSGGVKGEPGFDWGRATNQQDPGKAALGASVAGTIVEMVRMQQTDMATKQPKFYPSGEPMMQVAVTLQTELRGWQGIMPAQIPLDPSTGQPKHPQQDLGLRRIYVKNDMRRAVNEACAKVGQKPRKGGKLAVKLNGFEDRGKGNPLPLYEAVYVPAPEPDAAGDFFQTPPQAPAPQQPVAPQYAPVVSTATGQPVVHQQQVPAYAPEQPQYAGAPQGSYGNIPPAVPAQQPAAPAGPPEWATPPAQGQAPAAPPAAPAAQGAPQYDAPPY